MISRLSAFQKMTYRYYKLLFADFIESILSQKKGDVNWCGKKQNIKTTLLGGFCFVFGYQNDASNYLNKFLMPASVNDDTFELLLTVLKLD